MGIGAMISTLKSSLVVLLGMAKALEMFKGKGSISMFTTRASSSKEFEWFLLAITHLAVVSVAGLGWRLVASHEAGILGCLSGFGLGMTRLGEKVLEKRGWRRGWTPF
jgi:hypothetical protein